MLHGQAGVPRNTAHGECVHRIVTWNRHDSLTVAHDDVLALANDPKSSLLEHPHRFEMIDARDLGQGLNSYFNFANFLAAQLFVNDR